MSMEMIEHRLKAMERLVFESMDAQVDRVQRGFESLEMRLEENGLHGAKRPPSLPGMTDSEVMLKIRANLEQMKEDFFNDTATMFSEKKAELHDILTHGIPQEVRRIRRLLIVGLCVLGIMIAGFNVPKLIQRPDAKTTAPVATGGQSTSNGGGQ